MKNILYHIWRGCGTLPNYGEHPGTMFFFGFIVMGFLAGIPKGFLAGLLGALFMFVSMGILYFWGAYSRSVEDSDGS